MSGLNDNHKRRILTSLQYADKLLQDNLHALAPDAQPLFAGYIQDLSPAKARMIEGYTRKIREQMARLLTHCGVEAPPAATYASWKLRTGITSLDLTLEDIYPEKMRGYGKMDSAAAHDLVSTIQEIRRLVNPLLSLLSQAEPGDTSALDSRPDLAHSIQQLTRIICAYRLVEFLPALNGIVRRAARDGEAGIDRAMRKSEALRAALVTTLGRPARTGETRHAPGPFEERLRQLDELLAAFRRRWEEKIADTAAWSKEILGVAAGRLAHRPGDMDSAAEEVGSAAVETAISKETAFHTEYSQLVDRLQAILDELKKADAVVAILALELPPPAPFPLQGKSAAGTVTDHRGRGAAAQAKHIRSELQERLAAPLERIVQELQSRLQAWFAETMESLEESVRAQTDPMRYAGPPDPSIPEETRNNDLALLKSLCIQ